MTSNKKFIVPKIGWTLVILTTLLILYLHLIFLFNAGGLWRDEVSQINHATMSSISDICSALKVRAFPLFTIFIMRLWTSIGLGASDIFIRFYGFLVGISVLGALWLNARLMGYQIPLFSLALFGLNPLTIQMCDSIRPYGLGIFFIILTFGLIWKVINSPSFLRVLAATLAAVLSVHCLFQNAYLLLAICIGGLVITGRHKSWKRSVLLVSIGIVAAISLLPYLGALKASNDWVSIIQYSTSLRKFGIILFQAFGYSSQYSGKLLFLIWTCLCVLSVSITIYLLFRPSRFSLSDRQRDLTLFCTTAMVMGMMELIIFMRVASVPTTSWHFFPGMLIVAISLDAIVGNIRFFSLKRIILTILILGLSIRLAWRKVHIRQTNIDLITSRLEEICVKGDMIIVHPFYCGITFQRYYRGDIPWVTIPPIEDFTLTRYDLFKEQMALHNPIQPVLSKITKTLISGNRIWLVGSLPRLQEVQKPPPILPPAPNGPSGWISGPYVGNWEKQVSYLIQTRGSDCEGVPISSNGPINPLENLSVEVIKGWRTE